MKKIIILTLGLIPHSLLTNEDTITAKTFQHNEELTDQLESIFIKGLLNMDIITFQEQYDDQVINLISSIQQQEFKVKITAQEQPDLCDVKGFFKNGIFLIAIDHDKVIGTIGLLDIGYQNGALRKMFVHADYRGKGVAQKLLEQLLIWARQHTYKAIYLGTVPILYAAHKFYEKSGFLEISEQELPIDFPRMDVDKKFYKYDLANNH